MVTTPSSLLTPGFFVVDSRLPWRWVNCSFLSPLFASFFFSCVVTGRVWLFDLILL